MARMRHLATVGFAAALLACAACGTSRERECRVLIPELAEAAGATGLTGNAGSDLAGVFAQQAARSSSASRWLGATIFQTADLASAVAPLREALDRHAEAATRADRSLRALGIHKRDADAGPLPFLARLYPAQSQADSPLFGDAMALNERCGFLLATPNESQPECGALVAILGRFLAPAPDVKAKAHVEDRLAELAGVHSKDPRTEQALRAFESLARDASDALLSVTRVATATEWIAELANFTAAVKDQRSAGDSVLSSASDARKLCPVK